MTVGLAGQVWPAQGSRQEGQLKLGSWLSMRRASPSSGKTSLFLWVLPADCIRQIQSRWSWLITHTWSQICIVFSRIYKVPPQRYLRWVFKELVHTALLSRHIQKTITGAEVCSCLRLSPCCLYLHPPTPNCCCRENPEGLQFLWCRLS